MFEAENYNKGTKYLIKGNFEKALIFLKRQEIKFKEHYINLGNCYKSLGGYDKAYECYKLAASPDVPFYNGKFGTHYDLAYSNMGLMEYSFGNDDEAIALYRKALDTNPALADAVWNYSSALLRKYCNGEQVDVATAWQMYEFRFRRNSPVGIDRSVPMWDGITKVERLVVLTEQGFGDKIMFGRYIELLKPFCKELYVQCPDNAKDLYSHSYATCDRASDIERAYGVPLASLAGRFYDVIPAGDWLRGKYGIKIVRGPFDRIRVAVEWAGSNTHTNNNNRSTSVTNFLGLARPDIELVSFKSKGVPRGITALGTDTSWAATAKELLDIDLVVSVDTSIVHMAASMGIPTIMLQPRIETDFRWGHGTKSIWYDDLEVIQNRDNWPAAFAAAKESLDKKIAEIKQQRIENVVKSAQG